MPARSACSTWGRDQLGILCEQQDRVGVARDRGPDALRPLRRVALVREDPQLRADLCRGLPHPHLHGGDEGHLARDRDLEDELAA